MLESLHVKNLALMEETEIVYGRGFNILTGETGAGKSLLIGSVNLALGGKFEKEMLRSGAESALVELTFTGSDKANQRLRQLELEPSEDGSILISRRMQVGRSVFRINGEVVTAKQVKELAEALIDIHGQHEHQSLLRKTRHLEILDAYCGEEGARLSKAVSEAYREYHRLQKRLEEETLDEEAKAREQSLAEFEYREIEEAKLVLGEDEELEQRYRRMVNGKRIAEGLSESSRYTGNETEEGAGSALSRALRALGGISAYDGKLEQLERQLAEVDALLSDYNHDVAEYMKDCEFDDEDFRAVEERLNTLNHLKGKYGGTLEEVLAYGASREALLTKLTDYDAYIRELDGQLESARGELYAACEKLSLLRRENAELLSTRLKEALVHLNFLTVAFEIQVRELEQPGEKGRDEAEFMISVNPGEALRPLSQVASGGELSRIMLGIKTVLAGKDETDTLIFDEIDAGISGKTAWKVAQQLHRVAKIHQVICITHLPQIAAMADSHFVIEKSSTDNHTMTDVRKLEEGESLGELARLLGSDTLTDAALSNAEELRRQAEAYKLL
ncbi:MAG: DNA repair protein RecN [Roseburia sp.]|nr:DNA repair protein RecN [Roseburia sp.]